MKENSTLPFTPFSHLMGDNAWIARRWMTDGQIWIVCISRIYDGAFLRGPPGQACSVTKDDDDLK